MEFTHFDESGAARMVSVAEKQETRRTAVAAGRVLMNRETWEKVRDGALPKGDALAVARVAGIMAAKRTPELVALCHPIPLTGVEVTLELDEARLSVEITARAACTGRTGVEMEALTAVSAAALNIYDMCKAVQRDMVIADIRLLEKSGGRSGDFRREEAK